MIVIEKMPLQYPNKPVVKRSVFNKTRICFRRMMTSLLTTIFAKRLSACRTTQCSQLPSLTKQPSRRVLRETFVCFKPVAMVIIAVFLLAGCSSFGPRRVAPDRFSYNEALSNSTRDQMLLNLVRIRYLEEPVFLAISSILTQYVYTGGADVAAIIDLGNGSDTAAGGANLGYEERPTITYIPIEGREFAERMLSAIPAEVIFGAAQEGWTVDTFMQICISRIGAVENMAYDQIPPPGQIDLTIQFQEELEKLKEFQYLIRLLVKLADQEAFEVRYDEVEGIKNQYMVFKKNTPAETKAKVNELKQLLGLPPGLDKFLITERITDLKPDEISIQTRSLAAIMNYLAKTINVPAIHLEEGRVLDYKIPTYSVNGRKLIPFKMLSSQSRPNNAFAAVQYADYWFYIEQNDIESKLTLSLIIALFRVLAPTGGGAAPVLSLPTG